jgi:hypothetical protein
VKRLAIFSTRFLLQPPQDHRHPAPAVETAATNCTKPAGAGSSPHIWPVGAGRLRAFRRREFIRRPVECLSTVVMNCVHPRTMKTGLAPVWVPSPVATSGNGGSGWRRFSEQSQNRAAGSARVLRGGGSRFPAGLALLSPRLPASGGDGLSDLVPLLMQSSIMARSHYDCGTSWRRAKISASDFGPLTLYRGQSLRCGEP